jgi:hypothetical protein
MNSLLEQRQQLMVRKRELDASLSKPVLSEAEQKEQLLQQVKDDNAHTATFVRNIGDAEKRIAQIQKVGLGFSAESLVYREKRIAQIQKVWRCQGRSCACTKNCIGNRRPRGRLAVQIPRFPWLILSVTTGPGRI